MRAISEVRECAIDGERICSVPLLWHWRCLALFCSCELTMYVCVCVLFVSAPTGPEAPDLHTAVKLLKPSVLVGFDTSLSGPPFPFDQQVRVSHTHTHTRTQARLSTYLRGHQASSLGAIGYRAEGLSVCVCVPDVCVYVYILL